MARFHLLNVILLFLGVIYSVAYDDKKALTESSRLTARAAVDPWINVTRIPTAGASTSKLFGKCIMNSRRVEYKPSSVVSPSTNFTYWRYELGRYGKNAGPSTWDKELNVNDIFDCANAAADYRLFRFEGNKCSLANLTYLRDTSEFFHVENQPEGKKEVIFINFDIPASENVGNGVFINGSFVNVVELEIPMGEQLMSDYSEDICDEQYDTNPYYPSAAVPLPTLQNYLRTKKITGEFLVGASLDTKKMLVDWDWTAPELDQSFVVGSSIKDWDNKEYVVISSDHDYKLVVVDKFYKARGAICMGHT